MRWKYPYILGYFLPRRSSTCLPQPRTSSGRLDEAGIGDNAVEILFTGLDQGVQSDIVHYYKRSLTLDEATSKLANFIFINPEEVLIASEAERLRKEIEKLGVKVHHFPYYEVGKKFGGSLRCNTCQVYREG